MSRGRNQSLAKEGYFLVEGGAEGTVAYSPAEALSTLMDAVLQGVVYYVDPNSGADSNDGKSWATAFATVQAAIDVAEDWDTILLAGGDYAEQIIITQRGLKLVGMGNHGFTRGSPLFLNEDDHSIIIRAHDVEICNIGFYNLVDAKACIAISELPEHWWRTYIHDCGFSGDGTGYYGIYAGAVAAEAPYTIVERCRFYNLNGVAVRLNSSAMVVKDCLFDVRAAAIGIEDVPNSTSRPSRAILNNKFVTLDSTNAVAITVTNTPSAGNLLIDGNRFVNFADDDHCISKRTGYTGLNYLGVTAVPIT